MVSVIKAYIFSKGGLFAYENLAIDNNLLRCKSVESRWDADVSLDVGPASSLG